jgi:hypothetical protein
MPLAWIAALFARIGADGHRREQSAWLHCEVVTQRGWHGV